MKRRLLGVPALGLLLLVACSGGPSKSQAFEIIQNGVKEEGSCVLPVEMLKQFKVQHSTKAVCVPKEGAAKAGACLDALVTAGVTHRMPDAYMLGWPDDVASASLSDIPAYERRARSLVFASCVELVGDLRDGRFTCADVRADKVAKVSSTDPTHAEVRYEREIKLRPTLAGVDAACGTATRPPGDSTVAFEKGATGWALASASSDAGPN